MNTQLYAACRAKWTPQEFLTLIIEPVLEYFDWLSMEAAQLLLGTAIHESDGLKARRQYRSGMALGLFHMQSNAYTDIWSNYLQKPENSQLKAKAEALTPNVNHVHSDIEYNDTYAAAMATLEYIRRLKRPANLPSFGAIEAQAQAWRAHYNRGPDPKSEKVNKYISDWNTHVKNELTYRPPMCEVNDTRQ